MQEQLPPPRRVSLFERGLVVPNGIKIVVTAVAASVSIAAMVFGTYVLARILPEVGPQDPDPQMLIDAGAALIAFGAVGLFYAARAAIVRREKKAREARMAPFRRK